MKQVGSALLAFGAGMLTLPLCAEAAPSTAADTANGVLTAITAGWATLAGWIRHAHTHAPALVIGLAALLAIPPLALAGHVFARRRAATEQAERLSRLAPVSENQTGAVPRIQEPAAEDTPATSRTRPGDGMTWPVDAWIKVEGGDDAPLPIVREIVRIGREDDNDIVLPSPTVHRYHAVVQRTDEGEIVVLDLSGEEGNGVLVNGKRVSR